MICSIECSSILGDWISVYVFTACVNAADSNPAAMLETTWWRLWRKTKNTKIENCFDNLWTRRIAYLIARENIQCLPCFWHFQLNCCGNGIISSSSLKSLTFKGQLCSGKRIIRLQMLISSRCLQCWWGFDWDVCCQRN